MTDPKADEPDKQAPDQPDTPAANAPEGGGAPCQWGPETYPHGFKKCINDTLHICDNGEWEDTGDPC